MDLNGLGYHLVQNLVEVLKTVWMMIIGYQDMMEIDEDGNQFGKRMNIRIRKRRN